jgi:hypothetical protein
MKTLKAPPPRHSARRSRGRHAVFAPKPSFWHRRWVRAVAVVVVVALIPIGWSYANALTAPGGGSLGLRSVEWLRGHGLNGPVSAIEHWWYSHHPPPKGGKPPPGAIPAAGRAQAVPKGPDHLGVPGPIPTIATPALAGEGDWHPIGRTVDGVPTAYAAYLRPDSVHTSLVTGVAWMDTKMLRATLFAGYEEPGGTWPAMAPIADALRPKLVAAFNGGFRMDVADGGFYVAGHYAAPLRNGAASLVIYGDGTATVAQWGRDATMGPNVDSVRQNLDLIVDGGAPVPGLQQDSNSKWGATLGNALYVWRSGVGVTADGALVYAGGPGLSAYSLANVLAHAGAVRAMELDINTDWVDYYYFSLPPGAVAGPDNATKLVSSMAWSTSRYFQPSTRDFVTMSLR